MSRPYRPPPVSRASATTLCQKCLKRGHYSYECKEVKSERPYVARPSRTQQLLNPRLAPKLNEHVPADLVKRDGLADEILKQKAAERKQQSSRDDMASPRSRRSSTFSVSTISTRSSRSRSCSNSRSPSLHRSDRKTTAHRDAEPLHRALKRRLSTRSPSHRPSSSSPEHEHRDARNVRRRLGSSSPKPRGRDRRRRDSPSRSMSSRRRQSPSRSASRRRDGSRTRRRSVTRKARASDSPDRKVRRPSRSRSPLRKDTNGGHHHHHAGSRHLDHDGHRRQHGQGANGASHRAVPRGISPPANRPRSLSPYSKRLALTKAMG